MYRFYKIILIVVPFLSACSNEHNTSEGICECSDLQLDVAYNHFFLTDRTIGYSGKCEQKDKNGILIFEKNFVEGKMEGQMIIYYSSGKVKSIKNYKRNKQDGFRYELSEQGDTLIKAYFHKGEQDSLYYSK